MALEGSGKAQSALKGIAVPKPWRREGKAAWQAAIKRYEPIQGSKTFHAPRNRSAQADFRSFSETRSGPLTTDAPYPQAPRKKPFKVGDRVRTSHGTGTIVQVDDDKYLVDLDGQAAQLWEKAWEMRKD
jgi:hypothetical protein